MGRRPEKNAGIYSRLAYFAEFLPIFAQRGEILQFGVFCKFQFIIGIDCPPRKMKTFYNQIIVCKYAFFCLQTIVCNLSCQFWQVISFTHPAQQRQSLWTNIDFEFKVRQQQKKKFYICQDVSFLISDDNVISTYLQNYVKVKFIKSCQID